METKPGLKRRFVSNWKEYLTNCTLGGFKYIIKDGLKRAERVFWLLSLLTAAFLVMYYCIKLREKVENAPIRTTIVPDYSGEYREIFPAVTICSVARLSKSKLDTVLRSERYKVDRDLVQMALLYLIFPRLARNETEIHMMHGKLKEHGIGTEELVDIYKSATPSCQEMILDYKWGSKLGVGGEIFQSVVTDIGRCCGFNSGLKDIPAFGFKPKDDSPLVKTIGNGYQNGLQVTLQSDPVDYLFTEALYDGYKILVHHPGEFPVVNEYGFALGLGAMSIYSVGIIGYVYKEETASVDLSSRRCFMDGERKLKYFEQYTQSLCVAECVIEMILQECRCRPSFLLMKVNVRFCEPTFQDYACLDRNTNDNRKQFCKKSSNCLPACNRFRYAGEIAQAGQFAGSGLNNSRTGKRILALNGTMRVTNVDSLSYLVVYFKGEHDEVHVKDLWYNLSTLIATIGGLLSMGLGFSFISAVELVYFLLRGFFRRCTRTAPSSEPIDEGAADP